MTNQEIAKILYEMASFYQMQDVPFKPRAYQKAAMAVEALDEEAKDIYLESGLKGLLEIPGVGRSIAEHLEELLKTRKLKKYQQMKKKVPVNLSELSSLEGIGPKTIKVLYDKLRIRNLEDLKQAARAGKIARLEGFGQRSQEKILKSLGFRSAQELGRFILGFIFPTVEKLKKSLEDSGLFERLEAGGSYRRRQETVGDIDILGIAKNPKAAMDFFVQQKGLVRILEHGETKSEIVFEEGIKVDLRLVGPESWGAALQYFTGDKSHNIKLRKIAIEKGLKLSEYGLFKMRGGRKGGARFKTETEEQVYNALGLAWMPPELRTDTGEIEAALRQAQGLRPGLPKILPYGSVRGDLQVQTNWTDGTASIEDMARAAQKLGREYIGITDHTRSLAMTGGLDEKKLLKQMKEIDKINARFKNSPPTPSLSKRGRGEFKILKGAEVNILKDGSLDIDDKTLAKLDLVGVAVHSHFKLSRAEQTRRLVRALSHPEVNIFFHPTTRKIERREPIDFDFDKILAVAKNNRVALEIDAYPDRLDIHDTLIRRAVEAGVKLVIDTDAHNVKHLGFMHLGEAQARRGWASGHDVLNTRPVQQLLKYFAKK